MVPEVLPVKNKIVVLVRSIVKMAILSTEEDKLLQHTVPHHVLWLTLDMLYLTIPISHKSTTVMLTWKFVRHLVRSSIFANTKGSSRSQYQLVNDGESDGGMVAINEIEDYQNSRYVGPCEAVWRTLRFPINLHSLTVVRLDLHLPYEQLVQFNMRLRAAGTGFANFTAQLLSIGNGEPPYHEKLPPKQDLLLDSEDIATIIDKIYPGLR
ncbi:hypothetical protein BC941DRAFT_466500 [Chlamydoabsidia padenii]|nr:hypothetical protein BC941DRAFT_466500 [Chlamydoabsidia padenii]